MGQAGSEGQTMAAGRLRRWLAALPSLRALCSSKAMERARPVGQATGVRMNLPALDAAPVDCIFAQ
jgi:hypothetical protein